MDKMNVNGIKYNIIKLLGKGKGGYSYLSEYCGQYYVLKQIHHEPCTYYKFGNKIESEINDYNKLKKIGIRIPMMIDVDVKEERIIKEYIEGETIYDLLLKDKMKCDYIEQVKAICEVLYPSNTNIDYFPTNFIVRDELLYYIDYECNDYMDKWNFENWGINYWSKTEIFLEYVKNNSY